MIAKLAKHSNADRRHDAPVTSVAQQLKELDVAESGRVRIAPAEASHPSQALLAMESAGNELDRLYAALQSVTPENHPRTARLLASSTRKLAQKVIEEAGEVALAAVKHSGRNVVRESADLLYHLAVLWRSAGIVPEDIWAEMHRRADTLGIAEKLPKPNS